MIGLATETVVALIAAAGAVTVALIGAWGVYYNVRAQLRPEKVALDPGVPRHVYENMREDRDWWRALAMGRDLAEIDRRSIPRHPQVEEGGTT